ncbi:hypothetical protein PW52_06420 [Tamlana sedimentorum]|uniref:Uncharacterized protein n=1 Tax=Neotamlana sedimentorum TaxID=1435349 RepID=A0A0D7WC11_9FLAO|nr:hypothetical protein [Tamlana sedimentorum]KJD36228.1 hypothetical protein PW52_06420 [Tamlana sedimentorum]
MYKSLFFILGIVLFSCDNERISNVTDSTAAVEALTEYVTVNKVFQDVGNNSGDNVLTAETSASAKSSNTKDEAIVTIEPFDLSTFPKTITIDYGEGVLGRDGITRKGIITIISTNWYRIEGSVHTTTFTNFYHNDYKVEGIHVAENLGENDDENLQFEVTITNGKITNLENESIHYTENVIRTWIAGETTPLNIWDDEYLFEGSQSGISSKGVNYSLTTDEALHFTLLPRNIESGILDVTLGVFSGIKIDYAESTITILGVSYPFGD